MPVYDEKRTWTQYIEAAESVGLSVAWMRQIEPPEPDDAEAEEEE